ncbi:hypothetical protein TorRG33x02_172660 [Trema orientale]|uniref:Uncharacterized protein n=1 Tax=Trema orientale TaxID=63057 RepID=A0A2P5EN07_TREOI|nr:hypothetical protein TorRG33x02_172660 [Trema orientale]
MPELSKSKMQQMITRISFKAVGEDDSHGAFGGLRVPYHLLQRPARAVAYIIGREARVRKYPEKRERERRKD